MGQAQDFKVAFVDLQKFATKSVKARAMQKKLMDLVKAKQKTLRTGRRS